MTTDEDVRGRQWRTYSSPPPGFALLGADPEQLAAYGLPPRPDMRTRPHLAVLWDSCVRRYAGFEHVVPDLRTPEAATGVGPASLSPIENCGYSLRSADPFVALFVHWTVPHLVYTPAPLGRNHFHTFVGLGFIADVHVDMTVDAAGSVSSVVTVGGVAIQNLPVTPGETMSAVMCVNLQDSAPSRVFVGLANETRGLTANLSGETSRPPPTTADAGVTLDLVQNNPTANRLPRFGVVYFDEIAAYTTAGPRSLTVDGARVTMTGLGGTTLASAYPLNDYAFKTVHR